MSKESILIEELIEKKTNLVLQSLKDFKSVGTTKGDQFVEQYGKNGIYIAFIRKPGHENSLDVSSNITPQILFKNLFDKNYIEKSLYTGTSTNVLERCTAMRGTSMNDSPHGVAKYRNSNPDIEIADIDVLFISMGHMLAVEMKTFETRVHDFNETRTGKRFIAYEYSSVNGENGTKMSQVENFMLAASQDEHDAIFLMWEKRGAALNMERLHNGL